MAASSTPSATRMAPLASTSGGMVSAVSMETVAESWMLGLRTNVVDVEFVLGAVEVEGHFTRWVSGVEVSGFQRTVFEH